MNALSHFKRKLKILLKTFAPFNCVTRIDCYAIVTVIVVDNCKMYENAICKKIS